MSNNENNIDYRSLRNFLGEWYQYKFADGRADQKPSLISGAMIASLCGTMNEHPRVNQFTMEHYNTSSRHVQAGYSNDLAASPYNIKFGNNRTSPRATLDTHCVMQGSFLERNHTSYTSMSTHSYTRRLNSLHEAVGSHLGEKSVNFFTRWTEYLNKETITYNSKVYRRGDSINGNTIEIADFGDIQITVSSYITPNPGNDNKFYKKVFADLSYFSVEDNCYKFEKINISRLESKPYIRLLLNKIDKALIKAQGTDLAALIHSNVMSVISEDVIQFKEAI